MRPNRNRVPPHCAGADLRGANLRGSDLRGVDLNGADLTAADLRGTILTGADLRGATLRRATLAGAVLISVDLTGSDLTEADLTGAVLTGADLTDSVLILVQGCDATGRMPGCASRTAVRTPDTATAQLGSSDQSVPLPSKDDTIALADAALNRLRRSSGMGDEAGGEATRGWKCKPVSGYLPDGEYPDRMAREGTSVDVLVHMTVNARGVVTEAWIEEDDESVFPSIDIAALAVARECRFDAERGAPATTYRVPITFDPRRGSTRDPCLPDVRRAVRRLTSPVLQTQADVRGIAVPAGRLRDSLPDSPRHDGAGHE